MNKIGKLSVLIILGIFLATILAASVNAANWTQGGDTVGSATAMGSLDSNYVYFITGGTEVMRLDTNQNVGIGTSPNHKLHISDTDTTSNRAGLYVAQSGAISGTGYGIYATKTGASTTNVAGYLSATGATNNYGLIVESGRVGIGTSTPQQKLTLGADNNFAVEMGEVTGITADGYYSGTGSLSDGEYWYAVSALDDSNGETKAPTIVSATVTAPQDSVLICWSIVQGSAGYRVYGRTEELNSYWETTSNSYLDRGISGSTGSPKTYTTANVVNISADGDSWFVGGNIGIMTSAPGERLSVDGDVIIGSETWVQGTTTGDLAVEGDVGIGTNSPDNRLDIEKEGTPKYNLNILHITNSGNAADMVGTRTSILFNQYYYNASSPTKVDIGKITVGTKTNWTSDPNSQDGYMSFHTVRDGSVSEAVRINYAGDVGIGTISPARPLHIYDSIDAPLRVESSDTITGIELSDPSGTAYIYERNGYVGIGEADPDTILDINGAFTFLEKSSDPSPPDEGHAVIWMSDGTGKGDDGDVLIASNADGTTKWTILFDHSAGSVW
jgi:hypothetical protein